MDDAKRFKKCAHCGLEKQATFQNFWNSNTSADGFQSWCIECQVEYKKDPINIMRTKTTKSGIKNMVNRVMSDLGPQDY